MTQEPEACRLWLGTLERIVARAAHDVRGALNGVSVNLEVVRARSAKADVMASAVDRFANAASDQLEELTAITDALLRLARAPQEPVELEVLLRQVVTLLERSARNDGGSLRLEVRGNADHGAATRVSGYLPRIMLGEAVLLASESGQEVTCVLERGDPAVVRFSFEGTPPALPAHLVPLTADSGIQHANNARDLTIEFTGASRRLHELT
ncbi:MAG: hypothetical protein JWO05_1215 [Gemmatimonadetes bacterium]|nr:hypothetical protein [Gemmatimonadota bacterium]